MEKVIIGIVAFCVLIYLLFLVLRWKYRSVVKKVTRETEEKNKQLLAQDLTKTLKNLGEETLLEFARCEENVRNSYKDNKFEDVLYILNAFEESIRLGKYLFNREIQETCQNFYAELFKDAFINILRPDLKNCRDVITLRKKIEFFGDLLKRPLFFKPIQEFLAKELLERLPHCAKNSKDYFLLYQYLVEIGCLENKALILMPDDDTFKKFLAEEEEKIESMDLDDAELYKLCRADHFYDIKEWRRKDLEEKIDKAINFLINDGKLPVSAQAIVTLRVQPFMKVQS